MTWKEKDDQWTFPRLFYWFKLRLFKKVNSFSVPGLNGLFRWYKLKYPESDTA